MNVGFGPSAKSNGLLHHLPGVVDPLGVMPLLRRGVKNIVACVATHTEPSISMHQFAIGESHLHPLGTFMMIRRKAVKYPRFAA
jgi:hypothetical protein